MVEALAGAVLFCDCFGKLLVGDDAFLDEDGPDTHGVIVPAGCL